MAVISALWLSCQPVSKQVWVGVLVCERTAAAIERDRQIQTECVNLALRQCKVYQTHIYPQHFTPRHIIHVHVYNPQYTSSLLYSPLLSSSLFPLPPSPSLLSSLPPSPPPLLPPPLSSPSPPPLPPPPSSLLSRCHGRSWSRGSSYRVLSV